MRTNPERRKVSVRQKITEAMDIPADILTDCVVVKMYGNHELMLENYKGILGYSDTRIAVKAKPHNLLVSGEGLEIRAITDELLHVTGELKKIMMLGEGETI